VVLASERQPALAPDAIERPTSTPAAVTSLLPVPRPPRGHWPAAVAAVGILIAAAVGVALAPRSPRPAMVPLAAPLPSAADPAVPALAASPVEPALPPAPAASTSASATPSKPPRTSATLPPRPASGSEGFDLGNRR
jgi:hypothetical protein